MNVFSKILGGLKCIAVHVAQGFKTLFGPQGEKALHDLAAATLQLLKTDTGMLVLTVVEGLAEVEASGPDKQKQAFEQIVERLTQQGLQLGTDFAVHEINYLIEAAVTAIKGGFAPVLPAPDNGGGA